MRDHFIKQLYELTEVNPKILLISGDLGFKVLDEFRNRFPHNFINAGVAEQNMTGIATGLALEGRIVFTYSIGNFSTLRCLEQIRNDAAYHNANVKIVSVGGGFSYGALGISHHATEDIAIMRSLPDITVVSPCGFWETSEATKAIVNTDGTCYLRLDKSAGEDFPLNPNENYTLGKARLIRDGTDYSIVVTGGILEDVLTAHDLLQLEGLEGRIISMHTIKPFDNTIIHKAAEETKNIITVEEHSIIGGLGGAVSESLIYNNIYPEKFLCIGLDRGFSSIVGSQKYLRKIYKMDSESIKNRILSLLKD